MAEVVWQARRVTDGVLVDVTGDTAGTPVSAPTPNALEVGGGGGAIAVDNTVDPPAEVTTIVAVGADVSVPGEATLTARVVESETDPGAIGAGNLWVRLDPSGSFPPMLYVRNTADDGWVDDDISGWGLGLTYYTGADVAATLIGQPQGFQLLRVDPAGATLTRLEVNESGITGEALAAAATVGLAAREPGEVGGEVGASVTDTYLHRLDAAGAVVSSIKLLDTAGGYIEVVSPLFRVSGAIVSDEALYPTGEGLGSIRYGTVDPSAAAGVAAQPGSLFMRNDGAGTGDLWVKTGAADTAWTNLTP